MPVLSYLAYPEPGKKSSLLEKLTAFPECEVIPAENRDLLILVTDTSGPEAEENLQRNLGGLKELHALAMVSGFEDHERNAEDVSSR